MRRNPIAIALLFGSAAVAACGKPGGEGTGPDEPLAAFISKIRAVDNHTHANAVAKEDPDSDALPLETIFPFELPMRFRPDSPVWVDAYKAIYGYPHREISDEHMSELQSLMEKAAREQGERFPEWVLDQVGTEVMLTNRVAMGPGLTAPRFRWVAFDDALMLPLSTRNEQAASPDRAKLYPALEKLRTRYLSDLRVARVPSTLDGWLSRVVTPTLEAQKKKGAVAVKFEAALVRSLDFAEVPADVAERVYARYAGGGDPSRVEYKQVQDFIFRHIAREAGRLGMAVHVHAYEAPGNFFQASGSDPMLLEPVFNDPGLRATRFVLIHGGGSASSHTGAMLWKPNVCADISAMVLFYPPHRLAEVIRPWLLEFPEKVLFGTDAATVGPGVGWELGAWIGTTTARRALAIALGGMVRNGELTRAKAEQIATMVMRTNASKLYGLGLDLE